MLVCRECNIEKELTRDNFYASKFTTSGYETSCKVCRYEDKKARDEIKGKEYSTWLNMKRRCDTETNSHYNDYGGRGIKVCGRWINNYDNFIEDMGRRPSEEHSIDRINNDGNYEPENCKWSTNTEQVRNQRLRKSNTSGKSGVQRSRNGKRWTASISVDYKRIHLGTYDFLDDAIKAREKAQTKYWHDDISIL